MNTACLTKLSEDPRINSPYRVIRSNGNGPVVGYHVSGRKAGPTLLVAAEAPGTHDVFRRLLSIPTLPWLRGNLFLLRFDGMCHSVAERTLEKMGSQLEDLDGSLFLTESSDLQAGYWSILRFCARYGMISGRGVPAPALVKADAV